MNKPLITILGCTATGKTTLAANLAYIADGEVISADSRQVYRGMNIGTGKDYADYTVQGTAVPHHLIDIAEAGTEYNVFRYQRDFRDVLQQIRVRNKLPILCGGSGLYLEAVLKGYHMPVISNDDDFLKEAENMTDESLVELLTRLKPLHNKTDTEERSRTLQAILVARQAQQDLINLDVASFQPVPATIFGIDFPRDIVISRIAARLKQRLEEGMVSEVELLLASGISPERMMKYGLEYRFITLYLTGTINYAQLFEQLNIAIRQFAKRQMTWFRRMEKQGFRINWIDGRLPMDQKLALILTRTGLSGSA